MGSCMFVMFGANTFIGVGWGGETLKFQNFFHDGPIKKTPIITRQVFFLFFWGGRG